ncbi:MAG TPA: type II and III secretion system protein family protein [Terriglobales bacterium]
MRSPGGFADFVISILLATLVLSVGINGQTYPSAVAATPAPAPTLPSAAPSASSNVPLQQRVLKSEDHGGMGAANARADGGGNKSDPLMLHLIVGRSVVIDTSERLRRVYVANPAVLDSLTSSPNQIVLTAKLAGTSSVVLWSQSGQSQLYTVLADLDVSALEDSLAQALPGDHIEVKAAEGKVCLSGVVGSDAAADEAVRLASTYSKDVVNSLVVDPRHSPQVELKVRIAEVDRTKFDEWGINFFSGGQNAGAVTTGGFTPPSFPQVGPGTTQTLVQDALNIFYFNSNLNIGFTLRALQDKGILQVLAEPNLTTVSGRAAKFLAGGEFPYPVIQGSNGGFTSVTIQFRPYGIQLDFTPYVHPDGSIRLRVNPEVSALDYTNAVRISGYTLPAISTRKADTEIELKDGQSFAISGLLDNRITDSLSRIPGISSIPILGQLFRSKNLNHSVTELIVIVTPTVVDPLNAPAPKPPATPSWPVPFLSPSDFDTGLNSSDKVMGQKPVADGKQ